MKPTSSFLTPRLYAELTQFSGVMASGDDVNTFLQGQLTNDVAALAIGAHQRTGYCTPKGRLLATMLQWRTAENMVGHLMASDLAQATVKRLSMFVLRSKVKFSDLANEPLSVFGIWGKPLQGMNWADGGLHSLADAPINGIDPGPWLLMDAACPVMGDRAWLVCKPEDKDQVLQSLSAAPAVNPDAWAFSEIMNAKPWVMEATREAFVPQMINFEVIHGVSFSKGCYPGQEVVARTQYLGKLKRRMFRADIVASGVATLNARELIGMDVWSEHHAHEPCGRVVAAAHHFDAQGHAQPGMALLVESAIDAWESGGLHLQTLTGAALTPTALPYALSVAA